MRGVPARALVLALALAGCSSPPPPPRDDLPLLARLAAVETKLDDQERTRTNLLLRLAALEGRLGAKPRPDDDVAARVAAIESKLAALEDKVGFLEMARDVADRRERRADDERDAGDKGTRILDRKKTPDRPVAPAAGEVVKPLAAISGDTFSWVRERKVDLARLAGVEAPSRDDEAHSAKARERLEELLTAGELTFEYPGGAPEARALVVYARVKKPDGSEHLANELLIKEGLVRASGEHPRKADFERLEAEARAARLGIFAR